MPIVRRLEDFLKESGVNYKSISHPEAFTAQEIAAALHVHGKDLVKSVMLKADGRFVMAVLPASWRIDINKLKEILNCGDVRIAKEEEFKAIFPDCETGAEPPFGNLYNVETIVDKSVTTDERIYFNAGNHYEAVEMGYSDFERLVKPRVVDFAVHLH